MKTRNKEQIIIIVISVLCSLSYISLIWNSNVWMDEAFTASLVNTSFIGVLYKSMMDTLPPLYNIILKLMTDIFGYKIPVMKITSVIPMIATIVLASTKVRKRFGLTTAISFILCITGMPLMYYYGVEIRMYSLGFFFATATGIYAYEIIVDFNRKNLATFVAFSVLAGYSHHFAFVTVGFVFGFLLLYYIFMDIKNISRWFKCLLYTFIFYLPCLIITLKQLANVSGYFSMPDVTLQLFIQYATYPYMVGILAASLLCVFIAGFFVLFAFVRFVRGTDRSIESLYSFACFLIYYGVLLFGTVISKIMTANIFVDRYLFFSTGLLWLFVAIQIKRLPGKINLLAIVALIYITICSYIVEYRIEYNNSADEEIAFLAENVGEGDIFFNIGGHEEMMCCIPFYSELPENGHALKYVYPLDTALQTAKDNSQVTFWLSILDGYEASAEELNAIDSYGFRLEKAADFDFDRYKCVLYRVVPK